MYNLELFPNNHLEIITDEILLLENKLNSFHQIEIMRNMFDCECFLVGGVIRDTIWNKKINDLDFKVNKNIDEIIKILESHNYKRSLDYNVKEKQYYMSNFQGVLGLSIDSMDIQISEMQNKSIDDLIDDGDCNFNSCGFDIHRKKIINSNVIKDIKNKNLLFCNNYKASKSPLIIFNALKIMSREPEVIITNTVKDIIQNNIQNLVKYMYDNPIYRYKLLELISNINYPYIFDYFKIEDNNLFLPSKKNKLSTSNGYISLNIKELNKNETFQITKFIKLCYKNIFDRSKIFPYNKKINSIVMHLDSDHNINACCLIDNERIYTVAAKNICEWIKIVNNLVINNYNVYGTIDSNNINMQYLAKKSGLKIETNPAVIKKILVSNINDNNINNLEIFKINGKTVFRKKSSNYYQVLFRS